MPSNPSRKSWKRRVVVSCGLLVAAAAVVAAGCVHGVRSTAARSPTALILATSGQQGGFDYPDARRMDHVDKYHGVEVGDPYRWLEDPDSPESRAWIEAQNEITFGYLEQIPEREEIEAKLTERWNFERFGTPSEKGGRYFYSRNDGLQDHSVLLVADALDQEPRVLLDPNTWSEDGTVSLAGWSVSEDGNFIAYGRSDGGSDWRTWRIRNVETGDDLADRVEWVKFSGASWTKDGAGFFYSRYDEPAEGEKLQGQNFYHKLYFHRKGTDQAQDVLVYERPDHKEWGFGGQVTEDGRYLVISVWKGTHPENNLFYAPLTSTDDAALRSLSVVELLTDFEASYSFIGNDGSTFYVQTDLDAPKQRVVAIDVENPAKENWREIIPEANETLRGVSYVGGHLVASYLKDAKTQVTVFNTGGGLVREVELPGIGTASGFGGDADDPETFFSFTSYTTPPTIYRYSVETGEREVFRRAEVDFDSEKYTTKQVFYRSKDGTRVPMFITHRKGLSLDGNNPTLLYGYGGFNIPLTPGFSISRSVWLDMGGVYAVANLRGGGEYGEEWHKAGIKTRKQNVFDDFISAAEFLIAEGYTRTDKLAINGGSNGGLLVGACITQRPDLFGAALPAVGVLDMLRFNKFTIGWAWESDYGDPDENEEEFRALMRYSPYHNTRKGVCYPPTLITTADHDDRVVPAHSFKFAAALQHAQSCDNPALIRIETRAGHGAGKPTWMTIEEIADQYAFLVKNLGM